MTATAPPPDGARLGRYELLARLASGGMGEIFLARLEGAAGFEKLYAIKRVLPHLAGDARFRAMLVTEAQVASRMAHPNVCQVYELGETGGQLYIVMEYLEGVTALPLLRRASKEERPLDLGFVAGVMAQACEALHYAHELRDRDGSNLGVIHRDVTPSNVFLTESGVAKILDFGIARVKTAQASTQTGAVKGKYAYMAPEQLRGGVLDRRVDVFALGVVLFEMLALRRLFQRKTDYLTFRAVMEQPIPELRDFRPDVPDALAAVVRRALDREADGRFATARQLGSALLDALGPVRPWSPGEIGDHLRERFAGEFRRRHAALAALTQAAGPSGSAAALTHDLDETSAAQESDDDGDEFAEIETGLREAPSRPPLPPLPPPRGDYATGALPMPFGVESSTSGLALVPLDEPAPPRAAPRRALLVAVALGAVAVAAAALAVVWRRGDAPPPVVQITQSVDDRATPRDARADAPAPPPAGADGALATDGPPRTADAAPGPGRADSPRARDREPPPTTPNARHAPEGFKERYKDIVRATQPDLQACVVQHLATLPERPSALTLLLTIAADGRVDHVALQPDKLSFTPMGACMRDVMRTVAFPPPGQVAELPVRLTVPPPR